MVSQSEGGIECAYDLLSELFHKPIIEHLVETGRTQNLSLIYLMNEFGYPSNTLLDSAKNWNDDPNWKEVRANALYQTSSRLLANGRSFASNKVPVGLKFANLVSPNTGWSPWNNDDPDTLAEISTLMKNNEDVFAYDLYFNDTNNYDEANRNRLAPFMKSFKPGFFEIGESGFWC